MKMAKNMNETTHGAVPKPADSLHAELRNLIARQGLTCLRLPAALGLNFLTEYLMAAIC